LLLLDYLIQQPMEHLDKFYQLMVQEHYLGLVLLVQVLLALLEIFNTMMVLLVLQLLPPFHMAHQLMIN